MPLKPDYCYFRLSSQAAHCSQWPEGPASAPQRTLSSGIRRNLGNRSTAVSAIPFRSRSSSAHLVVCRSPSCKFEMPKGISKKKAKCAKARKAKATKRAAKKQPTAGSGASHLPPLLRRIQPLSPFALSRLCARPELCCFS